MWSTSIDEFIYNFGSFPSTPDYTTHYYYENFTNTTGVATANTGIETNIFPNPASSLLHVKGLDKPAMNVVITFTDALGRTLSRERTTTNNGELQLDVSYLSAGNYLLSIADQRGKPLLNKTVMIAR
jgi:hypothetical protein